VHDFYFTRGAVCSSRVLQRTEGKNHSFLRFIYYFLHVPTILIEKKPKICILFLIVRLSLSVMLTVKNNF
jgi:hypothetical protein